MQFVQTYKDQCTGIIRKKGQDVFNGFHFLNGSMFDGEKYIVLRISCRKLVN